MMAGRNRLPLALRLEPDNKSCNSARESKMNGRSPSPLDSILPSAGAGGSPHNPRKRSNGEVDLPSQIAYTSPPRSSELSKRPSTAPEQNILEQIVTQPSFEQTGFGVFRSNHESTSSIYTRSTMKPESTSASTNTTHERARTFQDAMKDFQVQLDEEYKSFEQNLNERDQNADLEEFDWNELEARYYAEIDTKVEAEQEIMNECAHMFQVTCVSLY
jgi:hypothetical protein